MIGYIDQVKRHYEDRWQTTGVACRWNEGPAHQLPEGFHILRFKKTHGVEALESEFERVSVDYLDPDRARRGLTLIPDSRLTSPCGSGGSRRRAS